VNETTTAEPTHDFRAGTQTIHRWVMCGDVDTAQLAAELRRWAEHFEPLALDDDEAEAVLDAALAATGWLDDVVPAINDRGVVLRWESTADRHAFLTREDEA
jgi:hypothetical protein